MLRMSCDVGGGFAVGHAYFAVIDIDRSCIVNQPCCRWPKVANYVGSRQPGGWCSITDPLPPVQVSQNDCAMTRFKPRFYSQDNID